MNISKATLEDIPELVRLINSAYRGEDSKKGWTTEADLLGGLRTDKETLEELMSAPGAQLLKFCDADHKLQGCVYVKKTGNSMYLGMLTVSPWEQAKGVGKKLLAAAEKYAQEQRCKAVNMTVISVREELIHWYEKHGYYKTGETKPFPASEKLAVPKQPLELIVMEKKVGA